MIDTLHLNGSIVPPTAAAAVSTIDFGVKYTPSTVCTGTLRKKSRQLEDLGVKFVRVYWVDFCNQGGCQILTVSHFNKLLESSRPGVTVPKAMFGFVLTRLAEGFSAEGEYLVAVDLSSLRLCGYTPGHASVFGFFEEKASIGGRLDVPLCPRTNLKRILKYAEQELNIQFLVGFETEFILLKSTNPIDTVNNHVWCSPAALGTGTIELTILEEIAEALHHWD